MLILFCICTMRTKLPYIHISKWTWEYCFFYVRLVKAFGDAHKLMDVRHKSHVFLVFIPLYKSPRFGGLHGGKLNMRNLRLNNEVIKNAEKMRKAVKNLPAAIVYANFYNTTKKGLTRKMSIAELTKILDNRLSTELSKLGKIGDKVNNHSVGYCAEVHAANNVLQCANTAHVRQIRFSLTIRPRTLQKLKYCKNCLTVFNVKN